MFGAQNAFKYLGMEQGKARNIPSRRRSRPDCSQRMVRQPVPRGLRNLARLPHFRAPVVPSRRTLTVVAFEFYWSSLRLARHNQAAMQDFGFRSGTGNFGGARAAL